jgi:aminopeptidase N
MSDRTASLTQQEAAARAALLEVDRYDIALDLTGLLEGDTVRSVATISFRCAEPGATTFVDCVAAVDRASLNGVPLDPASAERGRLPLPDLRAENVLVVEAHQSNTSSAEGIHRTVDPTDQLVYVWTSFEPDARRRGSGACPVTCPGCRHVASPAPGCGPRCRRTAACRPLPRCRPRWRTPR